MTRDSGQAAHTCPVCHSYFRHCSSDERLRLSQPSQTLQTPTKETKSPDAILGNVCWFCRSSPGRNGGRTKTLYGGLPILYCQRCAEAHACLHQDKDVLAAYLLQASRANSRSCTLKSKDLTADRSSTQPLTVPASTTDCCEDAEDCLPLYKLTSSRVAKPAYSTSQAFPSSCTSGSVTGSVLELHTDEDDAPSNQLEVAAQTVPQSSVHPATAVACAVMAAATHATGNSADEVADVDTQAIPTQTTAAGQAVFMDVLEEPDAETSLGQPQGRSSEREEGQQQQPANVILPRSVFESRPRYKRQYSGYVARKELPPLLTDEKRVLSHHLSPQLTARYDEAQQGEKCKVTVLDFRNEPEFRNAVKSSAVAYLQRHITHAAKKGLGNLPITVLPEDPPPDPALHMIPVKQGDYRKGLVPNKDLAVYTKSALKQGTVLGLYRNITVTEAEEAVSQNPPPSDFIGSWLEWRRMLEAYTADILQPSKVYKDQEDIWINVLQKKPLQCMAYTTGNIMAVINDGAADPLNDPLSPENHADNTALVPISVGRWPFLFVVTLTDIPAGEELLLNYDESFWKLQKKALDDIESFRKAMQLTMAQHVSASSSQAFDQASGAPTSQLQAAYSVPIGAAVSALSAATPAASGNTTKPGTLEHAATAPAVTELAGVCSTDTHLEEAGAESQPSPLQQLEPNLPELQQGLEKKDVALVIQHDQQAKPIGVLAKDAVDPGSIPLTGSELKSPSKQGVKRQRSQAGIRTNTTQHKSGMRSLPLPPGIEAAIRQNPGLVKGYNDSKVAHEQRLQKLLPDLQQLLPLCNQILQDSKRKQQQLLQDKHCHQHVNDPQPPVQCVHQSPAKKARHADAGAHAQPDGSDMPPHDTVVAKLDASLTVKRPLLRMESRTGSSGTPGIDSAFLQIGSTANGKDAMLGRSTFSKTLPKPQASKLNTSQHLAKMASVNSHVNSDCLRLPASSLEGVEGQTGEESVRNETAALPPILTHVQQKPAIPVWGAVNAVKTQSPDLSPNAGQNQQCSDQEENKLGSDGGHEHCAQQAASPTASAPLASPKKHRKHSAEAFMIKPVGKFGDPDRYTLAKGLNRSTDRKSGDSAAGFMQSGPAKSMQWKQQLCDKNKIKS